MWDRIVVQARDVPQLDREIGRGGFPIRSIERTVFAGQVVHAHGHMEGFLDARHRPRDIQVQAIAGSADDRKAVCLRETNHLVIILLAGTKPRSELFHREELAIRRTGRVVDFLQEVIQPCLVADGQSKDKTHGLGCGKRPDVLRLPIDRCFTHMMRQQRLRLRQTNDTHDRHKRDHCQQRGTESSNHDLSFVRYREFAFQLPIRRLSRSLDFSLKK